MARQLSFLEAPPSWRLDDATREAGRQGVAEARAALQAAVRAARGAKGGTKAKGDRREHPNHGRSAA